MWTMSSRVGLPKSVGVADLKTIGKNFWNLETSNMIQHVFFVDRLDQASIDLLSS